ncbi:nuclear factor of activated T-cells, cytoplasmic 2-like isoform X2 [Stigmatopora argus]
MVEMASDISQEDFAFSDLFIDNSPGGDFSAKFIPDDTEHPVHLEVKHHTTLDRDAPLHGLAEESSLKAIFDATCLATAPRTIPAPSPRIEITPSGDSLASETLQLSPSSKSLGAYRECASPASSNSSTGCSLSASPCISPPNRGSTELSTLDLCPFLQSIQTSSANSSPANSFSDELFLLPQQQANPSSQVHRRSRSVSPQGKRAYDQALPCPGGTPVKQRSRSPSPIPSSNNLLSSYPLHQVQAADAVQVSHGSIPRPSCMYTEGPELERVEREGDEIRSGVFCVFPTSWPPHTVHLGAFGGTSLAPLPSLEWPLFSQSSHYELKIKTQPRSHHRAHYETEGSRGPVKTTDGGHPEVQLHGYRGTAPLSLQVFIGTADERVVRPHAFYQAHRITGKTVTTPSMERMVNGTKVLEISLQPKNNMRALIDCVGILKRRNADIELRNGETDIGRKNTRVCLVFRVHVPHPGGQLVSLQVASHPIECSQHSAQEIPLVKLQNLDQCSALGGQEMLLTGQNFTYDSRVVFSERTQDGQQIWEVEATVDRKKSQANMLLFEVPPYRNQAICHPAKVNFYVINGKKKCSELQNLIYTPVIAIKTELVDEWQLNFSDYCDAQPGADMLAKSLLHRLEKEKNLQPFSALASDSWDYPTVLYPSRAGNRISHPELYYPPNQIYYPNYATTVRSGLLKASSNVGSDPKIDKLSQVPTIQSYSTARLQNYVQVVPSLGSSLPSIFIQGDIGGRSFTETDSVEADQEAPSQERVTIKQEGLSCVYLEDVNDIIRRDLRDHHSDDDGGLRHPRL